MRVAIGSDHAGFALKEAVKGFLTAEDRDILDLGTHSTHPVDYSDYAEAIGRALREDAAGCRTRRLSTRLPRLAEHRGAVLSSLRFRSGPGSRNGRGYREVSGADRGDGVCLHAVHSRRRKPRCGARSVTQSIGGHRDLIGDPSTLDQIIAAPDDWIPVRTLTGTSLHVRLLSTVRTHACSRRLRLYRV
jgi:Ribose/Galactose Isomerase